MNNISTTKWHFAEFAIVIIASFVPCLFSLPYRLNLFLAWDGAYRISEGYVPFIDFGTPVGYVFWVIPALFFKIFGPKVFTLVIVQGFINCLSGFAFIGVLKQLNVRREIRFIGLISFILTYSLLNIWPWYNHLVFVWELCSLWLLLIAFNIETSVNKKRVLLLSAGILAALAFMTKQDTGILAILLGFILVLMKTISKKKYDDLVFYAGGVFFALCALIIPFLNYEFTYWFNFGQSPHNSRVNVFDLINEFLGASQWIKFYLLAYWIFIAYSIINKNNEYLRSQSTTLIIASFILFQAAIIQVTSYSPANGNIYFHSFSIAFILHFLNLKLNNYKIIAAATFASVILLSSSLVWNRFLSAKFKQTFHINTEDTIISKNTFLNENDQTLSRGSWITSDIPLFENVKLPIKTVNGIKEIQRIVDSFPASEKPKILNFTELTQLAAILPYDIEKGSDIPLWYHKGVSFFEREKTLYCQRIQKAEYDLILFENIPDVNNFYSNDIKDCIDSRYTIVLEFTAPRVPEISNIVVYKKNESVSIYVF